MRLRDVPIAATVFLAVAVLPCYGQEKADGKPGAAVKGGGDVGKESFDKSANATGGCRV